MPIQSVALDAWPPMSTAVASCKLHDIEGPFRSLAGTPIARAIGAVQVLPVVHVGRLLIRLYCSTI